MTSHYTDLWTTTTTNFDWTARIQEIVRNSNGKTIPFDQLKKEIIRQYRQVKPHSDKTTKDLTTQLERKLSKAPLIARLGNDIYYLYYFQPDKTDVFE